MYIVQNICSRYLFPAHPWLGAVNVNSWLKFQPMGMESNVHVAISATAWNRSKSYWKIKSTFFSSTVNLFITTRARCSQSCNRGVKGPKFWNMYVQKNTKAQRTIKENYKSSRKNNENRSLRKQVRNRNTMEKGMKWIIKKRVWRWRKKGIDKKKKGYPSKNMRTHEFKLCWTFQYCVHTSTS